MDTPDANARQNDHHPSLTLFFCTSTAFSSLYIELPSNQSKKRVQTMSLSIKLTCIFCITSALVASVESLAFGKPRTQQLSHIQAQDPLKACDELPNSMNLSRRKMMFSSLVSLSTIVAATSPANARYVLNEDGEYDEAPADEDWQTAWKQRLDKAQSMSTDEIFNAARGAGNVTLKEGEESDASKKRRAMSACRDSGLREKSGVGDVKACNVRVMGGDFDFILGKM